MLFVIPMTIAEANEYVSNFHRHSKKTQGGKFAIGASDGKELVGVAIVGRPLSRMLDDGYTMEVLRVCVKESSPKNVCSFLYGRCWRIWQQMGGKRMITYTLQDESGSSLKGAGWKVVGNINPSKGWNRDGRERSWQPIYGQSKFRWEVNA